MCRMGVRRSGLSGRRASMVVIVFLASTAAAQGTASISGTTTDSNTGRAIAGAAVTIPALSLSASSDGSGHFLHRTLIGGSYVLQVHAVGYIPTAISVRLDSGQAVVQDFQLTTIPPTLAGVVIKGNRGASVGRRFEDFERRKAGGRGQFLTRAQIEARPAMNLSDLVRDMRGIRTECIGFTCTVRAARAVRGCPPAYFVDGRRSTTFGPSTPIGDIQGLEVYLGPSETPAEFLGNDSSCGVIAVWTKSSPY